MRLYKIAQTPADASMTQMNILNLIAMPGNTMSLGQMGHVNRSISFRHNIFDTTI